MLSPLPALPTVAVSPVQAVPLASPPPPMQIPLPEAGAFQAAHGTLNALANAMATGDVTVQSAPDAIINQGTTVQPVLGSPGGTVSAPGGVGLGTLPTGLYGIPMSIQPGDTGTTDTGTGQVAGPLGPNATLYNGGVDQGPQTQGYLPNVGPGYIDSSGNWVPSTGGGSTPLLASDPGGGTASTVGGGGGNPNGAFTGQLPTLYDPYGNPLPSSAGNPNVEVPGQTPNSSGGFDLGGSMGGTGEP